MKKALLPVLVVVLLSSCFNDKGGDNASRQSGTFPLDSNQYPNPSDTTSTANSDAYNTTDTGLSKGTTLDASGTHSQQKNSPNGGATNNAPVNSNSDNRGGQGTTQ